MALVEFDEIDESLTDFLDSYFWDYLQTILPIASNNRNFMQEHINQVSHFVEDYTLADNLENADETYTHIKHFYQLAPKELLSFIEAHYAS